MNTPTVALVIPAFDAAETLAETLETVWSQTLLPNEIVIVDDGSADGTATVAERLVAEAPVPTTLLRCRANRGPSAARNGGLAATTAALVAFVDADDRLPPGSLAARVAALHAAPSEAFVVGRTQDIYPQLGDDATPVPAHHGFNVGAMLFQRHALAVIGGFDESLRSGEDVDLLVRLRAAGLRSFQIDQICVEYRRRSSDPIDASRTYASNLARSVKRALDRTRVEPG